MTWLLHRKYQALLLALGMLFLVYPALRSALSMRLVFDALLTIVFPSATSPDGRYHARVLRNNLNTFELGQRTKSYVTSTVEVQDDATGRARTLIGHTADVFWIAFSPDGARIATTGGDRTIKLWDTATGREVFTLRGLTAGVRVLVFSPDGYRIVSSGIEGTASVWDATPRPAAVLRAEDERYKQKLRELKSISARSEAEDRTGGGNPPSQREGR